MCDRSGGGEVDGAVADAGGAVVVVVVAEQDKKTGTRHDLAESTGVDSVPLLPRHDPSTQ
jgi:hypothetical protein